MTRVDALISQLLELTPAEREEFMQRIDKIHAPSFEESEHDGAASFDGHLTDEQIEEFNRRIDDFTSGCDTVVPRATRT